MNSGAITWWIQISQKVVLIHAGKNNKYENKQIIWN